MIKKYKQTITTPRAEPCICRKMTEEEKVKYGVKEKQKCSKKKTKKRL